MPRPDEVDPVELPENDDLPLNASDTDSDPFSADSQSSTATDGDANRSIRDIQTQHGREIASEKRARQAAEAQVVALAQKVQQQEQYLASVGQRINQQEQARQAAYLASLPPEQQLAARQALLQQRVDALSNRQAGPQRQQDRSYTQAEIDAYKDQASQKILAEANEDFGLDDDEGLTPDTPGLNWEDEDEFRKSARKLARRRAIGRGDTVAGSSDTPKGKTPTNNAGGRPNSARPAAGRSGPINVEQEANRAFMNTRSTKGGLKNRKEQLRAVRDRAMANLDRTATR